MTVAHSDSHEATASGYAGEVLSSRNATAPLVFSVTMILVGCGSGSPPAVRAAARPAEPSPAPSAVRAAGHAPEESTEESPAKNDGMISILVSNSKETFCDGSRMDSAGYRKTLTKEERVLLPPNDGTPAGKAKAVAIAAGGLCGGALKTLHRDFTVREGVVRIPPIPGWAGSGIAMCTCKPDIEVNLLRLPGISKVVWEDPDS